MERVGENMRKVLLCLVICLLCVACVPQDMHIKSLIDKQGTTLQTRILTPGGYQRKEVEKDSLAAFLRNYDLEEDGSLVYLYNGKEKKNQDAHVAVFQLPIENVDLQQCADSIMRVYAEYYYHKKDYKRIGFHFVNGFYAGYAKWRQGYRIQVNGNDVKWIRTNQDQTTYESFQKYLRIVFSYASTLSMEKESKEIKVSDIQVGDIFIKGGSPGHVVMVVDKCENQEGKKAFLLAQGFMPAQQFHILKNERHKDDMWYYEDEVTYPFSTPEYTFEKGSLRRLEY